MRKLNAVALAILLALTGASAAADDNKNESGKYGRGNAHADKRVKDDRKADKKWEKHQEKQAKEARKADKKRVKRAEKRAKDDRKADKKWEKHQEKQAKEARKANDGQGKRAEKRERDWRQTEDAWHMKSAKRWDDDRQRRATGADGRREEYFREGHSNVRVVNGHLPPPGECRIWHPERPAGQQPPSGRCSRLEAQVPAGAWLIQRPGANQRYTVSAYDPQQPGVIQDRAVFNYRGGSLVLAPSPR